MGLVLHQSLLLGHVFKQIVTADLQNIIFEPCQSEILTPSPPPPKKYPSIYVPALKICSKRSQFDNKRAFLQGWRQDLPDGAGGLVPQQGAIYQSKGYPSEHKNTIFR